MLPIHSEGVQDDTSLRVPERPNIYFDVVFVAFRVCTAVAFFVPQLNQNKLVKARFERG